MKKPRKPTKNDAIASVIDRALVANRVESNLTGFKIPKIVIDPSMRDALNAGIGAIRVLASHKDSLLAVVVDSKDLETFDGMLLVAGLLRGVGHANTQAIAIATHIERMVKSGSKSSCFDIEN